MRKTMIDCGMGNANMNVVDPAEAGWIIGRAVVARWPDTYECSLGIPCAEDGIYGIANAAKTPLQRIKRLRAKVEVTFMQLR